VPWRTEWAASRFQTWWQLSCLAEELSASQERLCFVESYLINTDVVKKYVYYSEVLRSCTLRYARTLSELNAKLKISQQTSEFSLKIILIYSVNMCELLITINIRF